MCLNNRNLSKTRNMPQKTTYKINMLIHVFYHQMYFSVYRFANTWGIASSRESDEIFWVRLSVKEYHIDLWIAWMINHRVIF